MTVAVATAAMFGTQAFAQQPDNNQGGYCAPCGGPQYCAPAPCAPAPCGPDSCGPVRVSPFDGLNLTADQQTKLQELRGKYKPESPQERAKKAREQRKDMLKDIKSVLSSEQYLQFLENNFINNPGRPGKGVRGGKPGKGIHGDKAKKLGKKGSGYKDSKPRNTATAE